MPNMWSFRGGGGRMDAATLEQIESAEIDAVNDDLEILAGEMDVARLRGHHSQRGFASMVRRVRMRRACVGLAVVAVVVFVVGLSAGLANKSKREDEAAAQSQSQVQGTFGSEGGVTRAPPYLAEVCNETSFVSGDVDDGREACEDLCRVASCCHDHSDGGSNNCYREFQALCDQYHPCKVLNDGGLWPTPGNPLDDDGDEGADDDEAVDDAPATVGSLLVVPRPPANLASLCSPSSAGTEDGLAQCEMACLEAECCWSPEPSDNCYFANRDTCMEYYQSCRMVVRDDRDDDDDDDDDDTDDGNGGVTKDDVDALCRESLVTSDPSARTTCEDICRPGACCFMEMGGKYSCRDDGDLCRLYASCKVLSLSNIPDGGGVGGEGFQGGAVEAGMEEAEIAARIIDYKCTSADARDLVDCRNACASGLCCFDDGPRGCATALHCPHYMKCQVLFEAGGDPQGGMTTVEEDDEDVEAGMEAEIARIIDDKCTSADARDLVDCRSACAAGLCCFDDGPHGCATALHCPHYMKCQVLFETGGGPKGETTIVEEDEDEDAYMDEELEQQLALEELHEMISDKCTSADPGDLAVCAELCDSAACCFEPGPGGCSDAVRCEYYAKCQFLNDGPAYQFDEDELEEEEEEEEYPGNGMMPYEEGGEGQDEGEDEEAEGEVLEEIFEMISNKCTSKDPDDVAACRGFCEPGACCFKRGAGSCEMELRCSYYRKCEVLYEDWETADDVQGDCYYDTDCQRTGYGDDDPCTEYRCVRDPVTDKSFCEDTAVPDCCRDDSDCSDRDECNGAEECVGSLCRPGPPFVESCPDRPCYQTLCGLNIEHKPSCQYEPIEGCFSDEDEGEDVAGDDKGGGGEEGEEDALAEIAEMINTHCTTNDPSDLAICKDFCAAGSCCFETGKYSCATEERCEFYMKCQVLYEQGVEGSDPTGMHPDEDDQGDCETHADCQGPGYDDPCTEYHCVPDRLTGSTYCEDTPVPDCCEDDSDCLDEDECDGAEKCVANMCVQGPPFVESCPDRACYEAVCALNVDHKPSCQYEPIEGCASNEDMGEDEEGDEDALEEIEEMINTHCTSSDPNDLAICKGFCAAGSCCFETGKYSCATEERCEFYAKCQILYEQGEDVAGDDKEGGDEEGEEDALAEIAEMINTHCTTNDPNDLAICKGFCAAGSCCFETGKYSCATEERCEFYMKCQVLYEQGVEGSDPTGMHPDEDDQGDCTTHADCQGPGYDDPCTEYHCVWDHLTGSTHCEDTPVPDCCEDDSDCLGEDECDGAEKCVANMCVQGPPFAESCPDRACYEAFCALNVDHKPSCQYEPIEGCASNEDMGEDEEGEEDALAEIAEMINTHCTSGDPNDLAICKGFCAAGSCCFETGKYSCATEEKCEFYSKCQRLYEKGVEGSDSMGMDPYEDDGDCATDADCQGPGYEASCTEYHCVHDQLTGSTYCEDTPLLDCCEDDSDCLDEDECDGAEKCVANMCVQGPPFVESCPDRACYEAVCALNVDHKPSCQYEPIEGCASNEDMGEDEEGEEDALAEIEEMINTHCTSGDPNDLAICKGFCAAGSCCFETGKYSCATEEKCEFYSKCQRLYKKGVEGSDSMGMDPYEDDEGDCVTDADCQGPGYEDSCTEYHCVHDQLTGSTYCEDTPLLDCCEDDSDCLDEDECNGEEVCEFNKCVAGPPFVESCPDRICYEATCAVDMNHQPSCQYDPIEGCVPDDFGEEDNVEEYEGQDEGEEEEVLEEIAEVINTRCTSKEPGDLAICKEFCSPGACCFTTGADSCATARRCEFYMKCQGIGGGLSSALDGAEEASGPPGVNTNSLSGCEDEREFTTGFRGTGGERTEVTGIMFDVKNKMTRYSVAIDQIDLNIEKTGRHQIQVFTRPGTHVAHEMNDRGWFDHGVYDVMGEGEDHASVLKLRKHITIEPFGRRAFFILQIDDDDIQTYDKESDGVGAVHISDSDLEVFVGAGKDGGLNSGMVYPGLGFSGSLHYSPCKVEVEEENEGGM